MGRLVLLHDPYWLASVVYVVNLKLHTEVENGLYADICGFTLKYGRSESAVPRYFTHQNSI